MSSNVNDSSQIHLTSWQIQSSERTRVAGPVLSRHGFDASSWYAAHTPTTVLATLVSHGEYADPYVGTHLKDIPPQRFACPWWYRTEFDLSDTGPESNRAAGI